MKFDFTDNYTNTKLISYFNIIRLVI